MDVKAFPVEWQIKANGDGKTRTFEGYASTWEKDLGGDTIMPGAFTQTLADRLPKNLIKVRWMHGDPMGRMISGYEDTKGLYVVGQASSTPTNEERFTLMQDGTVDRLSIGYSFDYESDDDVLWTNNGRIINRLDLFEWSPVDLPMNEGTDVQITKAAMTRLARMGLVLPAHVIAALTEDGGLDETKAGRVLSSKNRSIIEEAVTALNQVLEADRANDDAGKGAEPETEPDPEGTPTEAPEPGEEWKDADFGSIFDDISDTLSRLIVA